MTDAEADDEIYVVERILKHHKKRNQPGLKYLIRWKGYSSDNDTWEDEENILDPEITDNYWKTRGGEEERILQSAIGTKQPHMVLDHEKKRDETGFRYFMRWKGHPARADSWVDEKLLDSKYIDDYWEKRGGKQQALASDSHPGKRKMDTKEAPHHRMSRRKSNNDEPLLMLDVTHNVRKHKHRHKVTQQTPTSKSISTPPSSPPSILKQHTPTTKSISTPSSPSSPPSTASESPPIMKQKTSTSNSKSTSSSSAASKQPSQPKSILKKRISRRDLASITSDLSTFDFDALTLSPTPSSSTTRQQKPSSTPSSPPSPSSSHPQQVPYVSFSEPVQDPTPSSSSSQTPEPEALVPRVKRTVEFITPTSALVSPKNDTSRHHHTPSSFPLSLNQSLQQHAERTIQSDLFKGQEIIFDLDFRSELSYDWENEIKCVETVIKNGASLYAIVRWKDNALAMYPTQLIQRRCHMKLIAFYERILEV